MAVVALLAFPGWPPRGDQSRHADPLTHQAAGVGVGDARIGQHVEDLIEQPCPIGLGLRTVDQPLRQLVSGTGLRAGQRLVEQCTSSSSTST